MLAELARGRMRSKIPDLSMALAGRFGDHYAVLARLHLDMIDHLDGMIARLDAQIEAMTIPFSPQIQALCTIPGIGERIAQVIVSEIGVDMSRFPTAAHLASWAGLCPGNNESAGKHGNTRTRNGNQEIGTALVEAAWCAARTSTYLGARFRRLRRRFGTKNGGKAAVAIAHDMIVITWHVLHDGVEFYDLGADYFTRPDSPARTRRKDHLVRELQALGFTVHVTPAAWPRTTPVPTALRYSGAVACPLTIQLRLSGSDSSPGSTPTRWRAGWSRSARADAAQFGPAA